MIAFLKARSRADLVAYGVVVLLIVVALCGPMLVGVLDPQVRASVAFDQPDGARLDPWGTPFKLFGRLDRPAPYSCGPNQLDENGGGDDVFVILGTDRRVLFHRHGTEVLFAIAVFLAVVWEVGRVFVAMLRAPRATLAQEILNAGLLAIGPTLALVVMVLFVVRLTGSSDMLEKLGEGLFVPLKVALPASIYMATFAALLAFRLRPPAE